MPDDKLLNEKGFVFIDDNNDPYWIAIRNGKPMMAYWNNDGWVNLREVTQTEIFSWCDVKIPEDQAKYYHKKHEENYG